MRNVWLHCLVLGSVVALFAACEGGSTTGIQKDIPVDQGIVETTNPDVTDVPQEQSTLGEVEVKEAEIHEIKEVEVHDLDVPKKCDVADDCPEGQGCVGKLCGPCEQTSDCRGDEVCVDGVCGLCTDSSQCPPNTACVDGKCGNCKFTFQCADDLACILGDCVDCEDKYGSECEGEVCVGGKCIACTGNEGACKTQYDDAYECKDGWCEPTSCPPLANCHLIGKVCNAKGEEAGLCDWCAEGTDDCEMKGGYPTGTQCIDESDDGTENGLCYPESIQCVEKTDCADSPDFPVCGSNHFCRECDTNAECVEALGVDKAICTEAGTCLPGADCGGVENTQCSNGQICKANKCNDCIEPDDDQACGPDNLCIGGKCAPATCHAFAIYPDDPCFQKKELCNDDHQCVKCTVSQTPDADCAETYTTEDSPDWKCCSDVCVAGNCCEVSDCLDANTLCAEHSCTACSDEAFGETIADQDEKCKTAYGDSFLCVDGQCKDCTCHDVTECMGESKVCVGCKCEECSAQLPGSEDEVCKKQYGTEAPDWICLDKACVKGTAHSQDDCNASGTIYDVNDQGTHECRDCLDDDECIAKFVDEAKICEPVPDQNGGENHLCKDGCPKVPCAVGDLCGPDHRCFKCTSDLDCTSGAQYPAHYICEKESCVAGCQPIYSICSKEQAAQKLCIEGQFCASDHRWANCTANGDCNKSDPNKICKDSACVQGCAPYAHDDKGQVCGEDHLWHSCTDLGQSVATRDLACKKAYTDLYVCEDGFCVEGCAPGQMPVGCPGQICGSDNRCAPCIQDDPCKKTYGNPKYICHEPDASHKEPYCTVGCTPGFPTCKDLQLCQEDFHCRACSGPSEDYWCANDYGPNHICSAGKCIVGECHDAAHCASMGKPPLCINEWCVGCKDQIGFECPSDHVCFQGKCQEGNCCTDPGCMPSLGCGAGQSCTSNFCSGCATGSDCYQESKYDCLIKSGACSDDNKCKPVEDLLKDGMIKKGYCFIGGKCREDGEQGPKPCLVCYSNVADGGANDDWTPGVWDKFQSLWTPDFCYIGNSCYDKESANTIGELFKDCLWCNPKVGVRDSLLDWSPRPDPPDPGALSSRTRCDDPMYFPGTTDQDDAPVFLDLYPYSGTGVCHKDPKTLAKTKCGYCWTGQCHGLSWLPWLPLGPAAGGGVYQDINLPFGDGEGSFVGSFGGGFGAGIPYANPGGK